MSARLFGMKNLARGFALLLAVIALIGGGILLSVQALDLSRFGDTVGKHLSRHLGHRVQIEGDVRLALNPNLSLSIDRVMVTNADAASSGTLAKIGRVSVDVEPLALLEGRLDARAMTLTDIEIWLDATEPGSNWFSSAERERTMRHPALTLHNLRLHLRTAAGPRTLRVAAFDGRFVDEQRLQGKLAATVSPDNGPLAQEPLSVTGRLEVDPNAGFSLTDARVTRGPWKAEGALHVSLATQKAQATARLTLPAFGPGWCETGSDAIDLSPVPLPVLKPLSGWTIDAALTVVAATGRAQGDPVPGKVHLTVRDRAAVVRFSRASHKAKIALTPPGLPSGRWKVTAQATGAGAWPEAPNCLAPPHIAGQLADYRFALATEAATYGDLLTNLSGEAHLTLRADGSPLTVNASANAGRIDRFEVRPADKAFTLTGRTGPLTDLSGGSWQLSGTAQAPGLQGTFNGTLAHGRYEATVEVSTSPRKTSGPALTVSSRLVVAENGWAAKFDSGELAGETITGDATLTDHGRGIQLEGALTIPSVDLRAFGALKQPDAGETEQSLETTGGLPLDVALDINVGKIIGSAVTAENARITLRARAAASWHATLSFNALEAPWTGEVSWKRERDPTLALELHSAAMPVLDGLDLRHVEISATAGVPQLLSDPESVHVLIRAQSMEWHGKSWPGGVRASALEGRYNLDAGLRIRSDVLEVLAHRFEVTLSLNRDHTDKRTAWTLDLGLEGPAGSLHLAGLVHDRATLGGSTWTLSAKGPSVNELTKGLQLGEWPAGLEGAYALAGDARLRVNASATVLDFPRLKLSLTPVGTLEGKGQLALKRTVGASDVLQLELTTDRLRFRAKAHAEKHQRSRRLLPDMDLPASFPTSLALDLRVDADVVEHPLQRWGDVRAAWQQTAGRLDANLKVGRVGAGGTLEIHLGADSPSAAGMRWALRVNADEADMGWALPRANDRPTAWPADLELELTGQGKTLAGVLGSSDGRAYFSADETERGADDLERWETNLLALLLPRAGPPQRQKLNCVALDAGIADGVARTTTFLLDAETVTVAGEGTLALGSEQLDLVVTPKPKGITLLDAAGPVRLAGPLLNPKVSLMPTGVAVSAGKILLGVVTPYALLAGFVSTLANVAKDENRCEATLDRAEQARATEARTASAMDPGTGDDSKHREAKRTQ